VGQEATDPGTDGFLALDDYLRFTPQQDIPMETLLQLYEVLDEEVTEEVIQRAVDLVTGVYINDTVGHVVAEDLGNRYAEQIPWTREHYLDAELPGSLQAEIYPTLHYQQALWARLHDGLSADEVTVYAYPESPRRLLGALATTPDSWLSVVFGVGVRYEEDLLELRDAEGSLVPTTMGNSRWGPTFPRIVRLMPAQDLQPGGWYTLRLRAGVETIDGQQSDQPWELEFQVECDSSTTGSCEDLGDIPEARTDGKLEETEDSGKVEPEACGCSSGGDLSWGLGLFGLGALRRKRRV